MSDIEWIYSDDGRVRQPAIGWDAYDKLTADTPAQTAAQTTRDHHEWYTGHHGKGRVCRHCGVEAPYQEDMEALDRDVPCVWPQPAPTAAPDAPDPNDRLVGSGSV